MNLPKAELDRDKAMELWLEEHSEYAKEQLVLSNIGMIGIVMKSLNISVMDEDTFATGMVGLVKAVNGFDISKGFAFSTYATNVIRNEILMTFRKKKVDIAFSLDDVLNLDNGECVSYADMTASNTQFEDEIECTIALKQFFDNLSEKEKAVIILTSKKNMTQCDVAKKLGISQAQVSRIIKIARSKYET